MKPATLAVMKTVHMTMMQAVRLTLILDNHQGNRKDLRMVRELRERIGVTDEQLVEWVKPLANGQSGATLDNAILTQPDIEVAMIAEEARRVMEILNTQTYVSRDLVWLDPLTKQLEALS